MSGARRTLPLAAVAGALVMALAGCGQAAQHEHHRQGSDADARAAEQPWLLALDDHGGADGESRQRTYVTVVPSTGRTVVTTLPVLQSSEVRTAGQALMVDAGHRWALPDSRPAAADRAAGRVTLYDLRTAHSTRTVDVRDASGEQGLHADWVSFDPRRPGLLRVVSGTQVWTVDVEGEKVSAERDGSLPVHAGYDFLGGFSDTTGRPYVEDLISFKTDPAGNGDDGTHVIRRAGGRVLDVSVDDSAYGKGASPGCDVSAGFLAKNATRWAFCQDGRTLRVRTLASGAKRWSDVGASKAVVPSQSDPTFVLPPA